MNKALITIVVSIILTVHLGAEPDFKCRPAEEFEWEQYVGEEFSTSGEMMRCQEGAVALRARIDELVEKYRDLLKRRGEDEALSDFNQMQKHWEAAAKAEIALISRGWSSGSGAKVVRPKAEMICYLRRAKALRSIASQCLLLNQ